MSPQSHDHDFTAQLTTQLGVVDRLAREQAQQLPNSVRVNLQGLIRKPQPEAHNQFAMDTADMFGVVEEELADQPVQQKVAARIAGSLVVAKIIDRVKIKTLGQKASTAISNALIGRVLDASAFEFMGSHYEIYDEGVSHTTDHYATVANDLIESESRYAWYAPKIALASHALRTARNFFRWANETTEGLPASVVEQQRHSNDELFATTKAFQRYGVKSAIAPAVDDHRIDEWLFIPADEFLSGTDPGTTGDNRTNSGLGFLLRDCEAVIIGTSGKFITSKPTPQRQSTKDNSTMMVGYGTDGLVDPGVSDSRSGMPMILTKGGELTTIHGVSLRDVFAEHGASEAYELLRSEILAIHFDLVTPALLHKVVEQELESTKPTVNLGDTSPRMGKLRDLILARQRVVKILGEDIEDLFDDEEKQHRDMVIHGVINHIRDLPDGYRASQEARDRCFRETGIILPEFGQTYVRKHDRGNLTEIEPKGHKTVHRNPGVVGKVRAHRSGRTTPKGTRPRVIPSKRKAS